MAEQTPTTNPSRWEQFLAAAAPEAPVAWLLEKLGQGASNLKQAVTDPRAFHERALTNLAEQIQRDPTEFAMNWTGGGLGGVIKPKGGNWLAGQVERAVAPMKVRDTQVPYIGQNPAERLRDIETSLAQNIESGIPVDMNFVKSERDRLASGIAVNRWLEGKLTKYIKNEMATPEDPLRLAADKWEQAVKPRMLAEKQAQIDKATADLQKAQRQRGVPEEYLTSSRARILQLEKERDLINARTGLHLDLSQREFGEPQYRALQGYRTAFGYPAEATAASPQGKKWEDLADYYMQKNPAGDIIQQNYFLRDVDAKRIYDENPWLFKVPPETDVYSLNRGISERDTGFKHMVDELRNAMNPESGLPKELQITAKDLDKMNVAQVAELVDRINAHRAVQKAEANALAAQKSVEVYKEYPDSPQGLRWVEMKLPEKLPEGYTLAPSQGRHEYPYQVIDPQGKPLYYAKNEADAAKAFSKNEEELAAALKYEGDVMQHCVGGYCPDVVEGRSRIFSLRDAKGQPYATVEVNPIELNSVQQLEHYVGKERAIQIYDDFDAFTEELRRQGRSRNIPEFKTYALEQPDVAQAVQVMGDVPPVIRQIKGPKNAKPADEVIPYVQDFVRSQKWSEVRDLGNADLVPLKPMIMKNAQERGINVDVATEIGGQPYISRREFNRLADEFGGIEKYPEGRAAGGAVGMAAGGLVEYEPSVIEQRSAELMRELGLASAEGSAAAPREPEKPAPRVEDLLRLQAGPLTAGAVRAPAAGYDLQLRGDLGAAAPELAGVSPYVNVNPLERLVTRYGLQYAQRSPGGGVALDYSVDPRSGERAVSGEYRRQLGRDSELAARGVYVPLEGQKPFYSAELQYRRRFAAGGSVQAYDEGKIQGLADQLREELYG